MNKPEEEDKVFETEIVVEQEFEERYWKNLYLTGQKNWNVNIVRDE